MKIPLSNLDQPKKPEKIKKLYNHCFEINSFKEGDIIPVGGSIFSKEATIEIEADFENFNDFFKEIENLLNTYDLLKIKNWLEERNIEIDEKLFSHLLAFTRNLGEKYKKEPNLLETRNEFYQQQDRPLKLSEIFKKNCAACAEISALAQYYLQKNNISSSFFSGEILWDKEDEFADDHSFIVIRQNDQILIYDPTNPHNSNEKDKFPRISNMDPMFDDEIAKNKKIFLAAKNIVTKDAIYYGVGDHGNIIPTIHIIE